MYKDGAIYLKVHLFLKTLFSEPLFIGSLVKLVSNSSTEKWLGSDRGRTLQLVSLSSQNEPENLSWILNFLKLLLHKILYFFMAFRNCVFWLIFQVRFGQTWRFWKPILKISIFWITASVPQIYFYTLKNQIIWVTKSHPYVIYRKTIIPFGRSHGSALLNLN